MKINHNLNLVCEIDGEHGAVTFHSKPILRDTFKKYHMVISKAFTNLLQNGLQLTGAKVAAMHLETVAEEMKCWEGAEGVKNGLMEEIARLTSVLVLTQKGWEDLPVSVAISRKHLSADDWEEAKQRIVFFILISAMTTPQVKSDLLEIMCSSWDVQTTSLTAMEYIASLPISKETESTVMTPSSLPI